MRILMLTPYLPYPLHSGGQIRTYNLLKNLANKHEITLFSFIRKEEERKNLPELAKYCKKIAVFQRRKAWSIFNILLAGLSPFPFLVSIYLSLALRRAIQKELQRGKYDLIHAETFYVMPNIPKTKVPILLVEQTIEYLVYQHFVESFGFSLLKPLLYFDVVKIRSWEKYYWKKSQRVVAMSMADNKLMKSLVPNLHTDIVPNGVDTEFFSRVKKSRPGNATVLFIGNFSWLQNREAVFECVVKIWPQIKEKNPQAKLLIIGKNPTTAIRQLVGQDISLREDIEDIREVYAQSSVLLAPLRGRGGTRYKILEAMASGVPVVTTPTGIEGLAVNDGTHVLVRVSPYDLAQSTVELLQDKVLAGKIARTAKMLVFDEYSWKNIGQKLDLIYQEVAHEG